uniref:Uncharacterized protein n=1 Tax=Arundo donax TaxID=35708 RepID=A0A0A9C0A9_ARUDO
MCHHNRSDCPEAQIKHGCGPTGIQTFNREMEGLNSTNRRGLQSKG